MQVPPVSSAPVAESVCKYAVSGPVNIVNVLGHGKQDHSHAVHLLQVRPTFWKCVQDQRPACWDMLGQRKNQSSASYHVHPCTVMAACRTSAPAPGRAYRPDVESWMPSSYRSIHTHTHTSNAYMAYISMQKLFYRPLPTAAADRLLALRMWLAMIMNGAVLTAMLLGTWEPGLDNAFHAELLRPWRGSWKRLIFKFGLVTSG